MSYGKEYKVENEKYFLEIFENHISVARIDEQEYKYFYEGDYTCLFNEKELALLKKQKYEESLYTILIQTLNLFRKINSYQLYKKHIEDFLQGDYTKEDILNDEKYEKVVFDSYFPIYKSDEKFIKYTEDIIDVIQLERLKKQIEIIYDEKIIIHHNGLLISLEPVIIDGSIKFEVCNHKGETLKSGYIGPYEGNSAENEIELYARELLRELNN